MSWSISATPRSPVWTLYIESWQKTSATTLTQNLGTISFIFFHSTYSSLTSFETEWTLIILSCNSCLKDTLTGQIIIYNSETVYLNLNWKKVTSLNYNSWVKQQNSTEIEFLYVFFALGSVSNSTPNRTVKLVFELAV